MNNSFRKISAIGLSLMTVVSLSGISPAFGATAADIQAQINALLATIQALQAQLSGIQGTTPTTTYSFTRDLTLGSTGSDAMDLQKFLNSQGFTVAATGAGSPGNETSYFGSLTQAALAKYQAAKGITPSVGYFGPKTRAFVGSVATGGTTTGGATTPVTTVPAGTDLVVGLASDTPASLTLGTGTAFNRALKVNLTAGSKAVNVTGITLQKTGFVGNTTLNGVDIVDPLGVRHGNVVTSINADNTITITFPTAPITVPAGQSTYIVVRFNVAGGALSGGSTVGFAISSASAITADTTAISGAFPITGNTMTLVTGSSALASTTLDVLTTTGSSTLNVDPNNVQEITRFRIRELSSNEGVNLYALTLYNYGNAGATSYKDVQLLDQTGNVLATAQPMGQYVTFNLATPYFIDKGLTKDFIVKAKLIGGTTQTINLTVYNNYDIDLRGATTMVSVLPQYGSNDTAFPIGNGFNIQNIGSGTASLTRTSDSPSTAVTPGASSVILAKYNFKSSGENMEIRQVSFWISSSTGVTPLNGTVYVKFNGAIVYSVGATSLSQTAANTITLSSYPIATAGTDNFFTIETSIPSTATTADSYLVKSFNVTNVKRVITGDLYVPATSATNGLTIAVSSAKLVITTLVTPVANSVVVGTNNYEFATIQLNAQSGGEDVKISSILVISSAGNSASVTEDVNALAIYDDSGNQLSTNNSTQTNAASLTFSFSNQIVVTKATPIILHLKANVIKATQTNYTGTITMYASTTSATGAVTGNNLSAASDITYAGSGQAMTIVGAGNLVLSVVSGAGASPSSNQVVNWGTSGLAVFAFKMTSQFEPQKITSLTIRASSSVASLLATTTLTNIKLYENSNTLPFAFAPQFNSCALNTGSTTSSSQYCQVTFTAADNLLSTAVPTTGTTITVKADIAPAGTAILGNNFFFLIASSTNAVQVKGAVTASTAGTITGTPKAQGVSYVVPQNVKIEAVSPLTAAGIGAGAQQIVGVFKITNNGGSDILLSTSTMTFANGGSATTTTNFKIYSSGQGGSQSDTSGWNSGNGYSAVPGTTGASSSISFATSTFTAAEQTITGGSWRYLTIKTTAASALSDTYQFSVSALGNILFNVAESALGYDGNGNGNFNDTIYGLYVDGTPSLSAVTRTQ